MKYIERANDNKPDEVKSWETAKMKIRMKMKRMKMKTSMI
jgi:hypothetical protein